MYEDVLEALEDFFGDDERRISHGRRVFSYAMRIQEIEGGDRDVVAMAAILHDVGIKPAEERYGSSAALYQEKLGPEIVDEILTGLGVPGEKISRVKEIVAHHHTPGVVRNLEFACLWDADLIVNLAGSPPRGGAAEIEKIVERRFMTAEGRRLARDVLLSPRG